MEGLGHPWEEITLDTLEGSTLRIYGDLLCSQKYIFGLDDTGVKVSLRGVDMFTGKNYVDLQKE